MLQLKKFRVNAGLTQAKLAKLVGVSQPNYQRWESGAAPIPEDKLKKLMTLLKTTCESLLGVRPPIKTGFYDRTVGDNLSYYGEVAIHFKEGGRPLLLSVSHGALSSLNEDLQREASFVVFESLANQTVILRMSAVADIYFSSEAYDDCGPEHDDYEGFYERLMPDPRDWEIVEALAYGDIGLEDFSSEDVSRVREQITITDEQYEKLVAGGAIQAEDLDAEKEKKQKETSWIFALATDMTYQLSGGKKRSIAVLDSDGLYEAFSELLEGTESAQTTTYIRFRNEGWNRVAFINLEAVDYFVLPSHSLQQGRIEWLSKALEEG